MCWFFNLLTRAWKQPPTILAQIRLPTESCSTRNQVFTHHDHDHSLVKFDGRTCIEFWTDSLIPPARVTLKSSHPTVRQQKPTPSRKTTTNMVKTPPVDRDSHAQHLSCLLHDQAINAGIRPVPPRCRADTGSKRKHMFYVHHEHISRLCSHKRTPFRIDRQVAAEAAVSAMSCTYKQTSLAA